MKSNLLTKINFIVIFILLISYNIQGQTVEEIAKMKARSNPEDLMNYSEQSNIHYSFLREYGFMLLAERGLTSIQTDSNGILSYYNYFDTLNNVFVFVKGNSNANSATTIGVPALRVGGSLGLNLTGNGMKIGIWETESVMDNHIELSNRVIPKDGNSWTTLGYMAGTNEGKHATHVAGTIGATGIEPISKGMAPDAILWTNSTINNIAELAQQAVGATSGELLVSNHSYAIDILSSLLTTNIRDQYRGKYNEDAKNIDSLTILAPYHLPVFAAGNERDDNISPDGYDLIYGWQCSKNCLTIGAVNSVSSYTGANSVNMTNFSNWGPTDDGRIKPDLCANGKSVYSPVSYNPLVCNYSSCKYDVMDGTSMASPSVAGALLLLQQHYKNTHSGNFMRAATLKGLAIHTSKEAGAYDGPDFQFGWGLFDAEAAAKLISDEHLSSEILEHTLTQDNFDTFFVYRDNNSVNSGSIKATLSWTDPTPQTLTPFTSINDPTPMLVNDLDLRIIDLNNTQEQFPWRIDNSISNAIAAVKQDNFKDNVEKVESQFQNIGVYKIVVKHKGNLIGGQQNYALIISGAHIIPSICNTPTGLTSTNITSNSIDIQWSKDATALNYTLNYKLQGAMFWNTMNISSNSVTLSSLLPNSTYLIEVSANCIQGGATSFTQILIVNTLSNQNTIGDYEYWYNDQYANKIVGNNPFSISNQDFIFNASTLVLTTNQIHSFNFRCKNSSGIWSSVLSSPFMKIDNLRLSFYEYWFDNDYANVSINAISPTCDMLNLNSLLNSGNLNSGLHQLHIRFKNLSGIWSNPLSHPFMKIDNMEISAFEYWFDNDYSDRILNPISPVTSIFDLNNLLSTGNLNAGLHHLHIRFKNLSDTWSNIITSSFMKVGNMDITSFEYWYDNDYANVISSSFTSPQSYLDLTSQLSATNLSSGLHNLHIRFKNVSGDWSNILTENFYKIDNMNIAGYEYWFDNNIGSSTYVTNPSPSGFLDLNSIYSTTNLSDDIHAINFRFKNVSGNWSSILTHVFKKSTQKLIAFEYWYNNDVSNKITTNFSPTQYYEFQTNFDISTLNYGSNTISIRFKDDSGIWSSNIIHGFCKGLGDSAITIKCFIEGYYDGNSQMKSVLLNQGMSLDNSITDSVEIQLRESNSPFNIVASKHDVVKTNGKIELDFPGVIAGYYYIVVRHRNTIETWSSNAVYKGDCSMSYDFTTNSNKAYAGNQKEVEPGIFAFYSGDIFQDENIDLLDNLILESDINNFQSGYISTDINGDGNVDLLDNLILENNITQFIYSIHP